MSQNVMKMIVANTLTHSFEKKMAQKCFYASKPVFYSRYVDNIFVLLFSLNHAKKFAYLANIPT